jgi:hypothetical protein
MKKWLNSENVTTFALNVAAVVVGILVAPLIIGWVNKAKAKTSTAATA